MTHLQPRYHYNLGVNSGEFKKQFINVLQQEDLKKSKRIRTRKKYQQTKSPLDKKHHGISMEQPNYCTNINIKDGMGISIFAFIK